MSTTPQDEHPTHKSDHPKVTQAQSIMDYRDLCGWADSKPFRFLIGPEEREFSMHSALVAAQSPALYALVNNGMKESLSGCVSLPQWEVPVFVRFLEFAYTGDFASPMARRRQSGRSGKSGKKPRKKDDDGDDDDDDDEDNPLPVPRPFNCCKKSKCKWKKYASEFNCSYNGTILYDVPWHPCAGDDGEDQALTSIAKVYIFADCYGIEKLLSLCIYKLYQFLIQNTNVPCLTALIQLCLVETCPQRLRDFVLNFAAFHFRYLIKDTKFSQQVAEHPGVFVEIAEKFWKHADKADDEQVSETEDEKDKTSPSVLYD